METKMDQNIAIICHKGNVGKQVASMLAASLEMHFLDIFDLLEFDDQPRTLSKTLEKFGSKQVREHELSLVSYVTDFSKTVFNCESGMIEKVANIKKIKENAILVYLHTSADQVKQSLEKIKYETIYLKRFFNITKNKIEKRIEISNKFADIKLNITNKSVFKITSEALREIKKNYGV